MGSNGPSWRHRCWCITHLYLSKVTVIQRGVPCGREGAAFIYCLAEFIFSGISADSRDLIHLVHPPLIGHYTNFWPLLIWTLLPNLTFNPIVQGFHRTYATGAACQQRMLTLLDTWSCPTLGLACVLMSRPISPELVLSPDFWISNIPRYFSFAFDNNWLL